MNEFEIMNKATNLVLHAWKSTPIHEVPRFVKDNEYQTFVGSIAGVIEGIAELVKEDDIQLYNRLLDSIEKVSLR